jgi:hypothetical protein
MGRRGLRLANHLGRVWRAKRLLARRSPRRNVLLNVSSGRPFYGRMSLVRPTAGGPRFSGSMTARASYAEWRLRAFGPSRNRSTAACYGARGMTLLLLALAAGSVGYLVGKVWAILIPLVIGSGAAVAIAVVGGSLYDAPIPFTIAVATLASALGLMIRRRRTALSRT